jgi:flagellar biosynthesis chaperone FliJ
MNKERRKALSSMQAQLEGIKAEIADIRAEEQDYFDNMPESLQGGDKGQQAEAAIGLLDEAISQLEEASGNLESASE